MDVGKGVARRVRVKETDKREKVGRGSCNECVVVKGASDKSEENTAITSENRKCHRVNFWKVFRGTPRV